MPPTRFPRAVFFAVVIATVALAAFFFLRPAQPAQAGTTIELNSPLNQEGASPDVVQAIGAIQDEAGISAWFNAGQAVNLALIAPLYRTIETQNSNYIIGSVAVPGYYENHDVHVYAHKDGWFMAYYLKGDPAAKIADIFGYPTEGLRTKFEVVLNNLASTAGVAQPVLKFWDFRYPNANRVMLIGETAEEGDTFTLKLPSTFTFYERSWAQRGWRSNPILNGANIGLDCDGCYGTISASELALETTHSFRMAYDGSGQAIVVALTYRAP